MLLCILAKDEDVEAVRATALSNCPEFQGQKLLTVPVSATGHLPATHWFCCFPVSKPFYEKLMSVKKLSEMELDSPQNFLKERNLKIIY